MNLLHRFGKPQEHDSHNGVVLSVGAAVKLYKHRLGGDLLGHAKSLGYKTIVAMLRDIFNDGTFREHGVQVSRTGPKKELVLSSSLSLRLARESAYEAEFVQFSPSGEDELRMTHTGTTFQLPQSQEKYKTFSIMEPDVMQPLSAAVRISQADAESGRFQTGMECNAFVHSYDTMGDNGSPLLTCAIDPPRAQIRGQMKRRAYVKRQEEAKEMRKRDNKLMESTGPRRNLKELKVGDGPYTATILRVSSRAGAAFVDLGVSRQRGKKAGGGTTQVLGMLRFEDVMDNVSDDANAEAEAAIIEASLNDSEEDDYEDDAEDGVFTIDDLFMDADEGEETVEDVSDIYSITEDGDVSMADAATGESKVIGSANSEEGDEVEDDDDDDDNMFAGMSPEERLNAIADMLATEEKPETESLKSKVAKVDSQLKEGDRVEVYIRAVSPQSGRFMVTLDSSIKGRKLKDIKKEKEAEKRMERMKGDLDHILSNIGVEMEGTVRAKSKTGDWYYVQPDSDGFPVGVARSETDETIEPGQQVKIVIDGIDETRGQVALTIKGAIN